MSLPSYQKYKDSGVEWLGWVPQDWKLKPLWTLFRRTKRQGFTEEQLLSVYRDYGVVPKASRDDNNNKPSDDLEPYQLVEPGDLAINKMKAWQGSVAISQLRGIVSPAYFVYEARHAENSRYLHYLMRSQRYITGYLSISKGIRVGQWDLEPQYHSRIPLLVPDKDEQDSIASFLDGETAKIDALVEEQKRLIELLKEKRQAAISHAVTKGLNSNAPMKDSGVAWLGDVPAHWEVMPCRAIVFEKTDKNDGAACQEYLSLMANVGIIPYAEKGDVGNKAPEDLSKCKLVCVGDIVINSMNYGIGSFGLSDLAGVCSPVYVVVRPINDIVETRFAFRIFANRTFQTYAQSFGNGILAHRAAIGWDTLKGIPVPVPPLDEQLAILNFLDVQTLRFDNLTEEAEVGIALLQERRTALISAAVTGKIDVRSKVKPPEPALA